MDARDIFGRVLKMSGRPGIGVKPRGIEEGSMRTITCLFFAVATLFLGNIRAGVGQSSDALSPIAAFVFVIAAVVFAFMDWPGLPTRDVADRAAEDAAESARRRAKATSDIAER